MTEATMALTELAKKGPDLDVIRQIQFVAQRLMGLDVETLCGAGYDIKSAERANSRNGYWDRLCGHPRRRHRAEDSQAQAGRRGYTTPPWATSTSADQ